MTPGGKLSTLTIIKIQPLVKKGQYPRRLTQSGTVPLFVEQFYKKWNSSTICGTVSQKCGTAPQKVEQVLKSGHCSTNCGTAPAKSGTGTMNSTTKVTNGMLFQDVIQCTPLNAHHMVVDRHTNYHFE